MATTSADTRDIYDSAADDGQDLEIQSMGFSATALDALANPSLWHLGTQYKGSANFIEAWSQVSAAGVVIGLVDEGVNYRHVDLQGAYDASIDYDPRDVGDSDAMPDTTAQHHGTNVAGIIAGDINNLVGGVGAAQGATITASYMRFGALSDFNEIDDIIAHQVNYDVSNNSWGFTQSFGDNFRTGQFAAIAQAMQSVVEDGRDGLGTVMVVAAGNGKMVTAQGNIGDDSNFHNFSNSRFVITVGAHDETGAPAFFSSPGTNVLLTAPGVAILTSSGNTDGANGYTITSGTSSATPLVSSAVALMLATNPDLGYRDIQQILAISATSRVDGHSQENGFDGFNGGGLMYDRDGGFGMLDASAAVALARNWSYTSTFANEQQLDFSFAPTGNLDPSHATLTYDFTAANAADFSTGYVTIDLAISDNDLKDLQVHLISPDGTDSELAESFVQVGSRTYLSFTFSSVAMLGENPYGTWRLEFSHVTPTDPFTVYQADVHVYGDVRTADDTYYYTSSYAELVATDASRAYATDTDGGNDTLNFAAGHTGVVLDLSGVTASTFQGVPVYLDGAFENAIGTIHDDALTGSAAANTLIGDMGNDIISGGAGNDTLLGGSGNDQLAGGAGSDTIDGGAGVDRAVFDAVWADYDITYNAAAGTYALARHGSADIDLVSGVELFDFMGSVIDISNSAAGLLTGSAPSLVSIAAPATQGGSGHRSIAIVTAADANLAAGDQLVFALTNADGSPYTGSLSISQTSSTTAEIYTSDAAFQLQDNPLVLFVKIHDLAGHTVTRQLDLNSLAAPPVPQTDAVPVETALASYTLAANVLNLTHTGSSDFVGIGNALNNVLIGGTGNDYLVGFAGNDVLVDGNGLNTLQGGTGDDLYAVQSNNDTVFEFANEGIDQVQTFLSFYRLSPNIENLTFVAAIDHTGIGNDLDNVLTGAGGNDTLDGGLGADQLVGGAGNDSYIVDNSGDVVVENTNEGTDTVRTALSSYALTANVENLTHTGSNDFTGTGNNLNNVLTGGTGIDHLIGGAGNDTYIVNNASDVVENANEGTDTVQTAGSYYMLSANIENLTHTGEVNFTGIGNDLNNLLIGGTGNDYLIGLDGNDVLVDGNGLNTLQGGAGNDIYAVQSNADTVFEFANEGTDQVQTFLSFYHLSANVEDLIFIAAVDHNGVGNELDNAMSGNGGNDVLNGREGNDTLTGGAGADQFVFSTALSATNNVDRITDFTVGTDKIALDHSIFTAVGSNGALSASMFTTGTPDADDRIIYNADTGALSYDADGSGNAAAIQFATLSAHLNLTNQDFLVI